MSTIIKSYKADPIGRETVPGLIIQFTDKLPKAKSMADMEALHREEAERIVAAMEDTLPQGLQFQIMVSMMVRFGHSFLFRVRKQKRAKPSTRGI